MNAEKALNWAVNNPCFLGISGSRLYGTDMPESDYDLRGFTIPPFEYLLGIKTFNSQELDGDHKIYSLKRFLELLLNGDPQVTELLFSPPSLVKTSSIVGEKVLDLGKKYALSNKSYARIMGFSNGEWRKAMAIKLVPEKRKKEEPEILNDLWNCFEGLSKDQKDLVIKTLNDGRPHKEISSVAGLGKKRREQVEKHGYCTKSAAHSIRLVGQVTELMLTGSITFPRPDAKILRDIRNGELNKSEITAVYESSRNLAESVREKSILRESPDPVSIWEGYKNIVIDHLKEDDRFNKL
jgi:hypothetical protein